MTLPPRVSTPKLQKKFYSRRLGDGVVPRNLQFKPASPRSRGADLDECSPKYQAQSVKVGLERPCPSACIQAVRNRGRNL